jgi:Fe-S-cluster containining protein
MSVNPCQICKANCCKNYDVFIDHEDLLISDNSDFIKKVEYKKSFGYVPKFKLWEDGKKKWWVLALKNPGKVCHFLKDDRCSIYEQRPLICRTYPHWVDDEKIKIMKDILCPIKWKLSDHQQSQIKSDYNKLLVNFLAFETICDMWNKMVKKEDTLENFIIFVKNYNFYDN